jgi:hypothetical protein
MMCPILSNPEFWPLVNRSDEVKKYVELLTYEVAVIGCRRTFLTFEGAQ